MRVLWYNNYTLSAHFLSCIYIGLGVSRMKKKIMAGILSVLMSVTMYSPVKAEEINEPAGDEPEITEIQETEESAEAVPEEAGEPEEEEVISETAEEEPEAEAGQADDKEADAPAASEPAAEEPAEPAEPAEAEEPAEVIEEPAEVTLITPDPVTYNGVTVTVSYYSDTFGGKDVNLVVGDAGAAETAALNALGEDYKAVDISFVDADGNPVQPDEGKKVDVSLKAAGMEAAADYDVVHVDDTGRVDFLTAEPETGNAVTAQVKTGETTRTVYVPEKTETVTVEDYREETYTDYETRETTVEVPAEIGYHQVLKTRMVEKEEPTSLLRWLFSFGRSSKSKKTKLVAEYYYETEPYVIREAYTKTETETVPVEKTRTVLAGTHEETRVIAEAYSYEVTEDVYEDVTYNDVEASFSASGFSVYAIVAVDEDGSVDFDETFGADHITVKAPAGAFEAGTVMKIETVDDPEILAKTLQVLDDNTYRIYGVDISFWKDGVEVEPAFPVRVTWTSDYIDAGDRLVHITDDGKAELVDNVLVRDNKVVFTADSFSTYTTTRLDSIDLTADYANAIIFHPETLTRPASMSSGLLASTHPEFDGYTYQYATYRIGSGADNPDKVIYLGAFIYREFDGETQVGEDQTFVYYRTEANADNDLIVQLADNETIHLYYDSTPLTVTYNVEYNGTTYHMANADEVAALQAALGSDFDALVYEGPASVKRNTNYPEAVRVEIPRGYTGQLRYGNTAQTPQLGAEPTHTLNSEHKIITRSGDLDLDYNYDINTSQPLTVTLTLTKRTSFTFDASYFLRTVYTGGYYNNQDANYGDYRISNTIGARIYGDGTLGTSGTGKGKKTFTADSVSWTFTTQNKKDSGKNQSGDQWMVDALEINGTTIEIPYANPGDSLPVSKTTTLPSGTVVTVSLTNIVNERDNYTGATRTNYRRTYTISVSNCYEDIVITGGNIVDIDVSTEIIPEVLDNVVYAFNGYSTSDRAYSGTGFGWQTWGVGEPIAVGANQSVQGGRNWNMYGFNQTNNNAMRFSVPTGYYNPEIAFVTTTEQDLIGNVQLGNGLSRGAKNADGYYPINGNPTGGNYYFRVTNYTNNGNVALLRIRASLMRYGVSYAKGDISVDASIPAYDYGGWYDDAHEQLQGYNVVDNDYVVIDKSAPTAEGYVFLYYTIQGDSSNTQYSPSQKVALEAIADFASYDESKKEFVIPLIAHWQKKEESDNVTVTAHIILDDDDDHPTDVHTVVPEHSSIYIDIDSETMTEYMDNYNWQLFYDEMGSSPFIRDVTEENNEVTLRLYSKFYVYHSATGTLELHTTKEMEYTDPADNKLKIGNLDLAAQADKNSLYGGYYMDYAGAYEGGTNVVKAAADDNNENGTLSTQDIEDLSAGKGVVIGTVGTPYHPDTTAAHGSYWNVSNAFTATPKSIAVSSGWYSNRGTKDTAALTTGGKGDNVQIARAGIYYIKEVPTCYLRNYYQITFMKTSRELTGLYLISAVDDLTYNESGFVLTSSSEEALVVESLKVTNSGTGKTTTLLPTTVFKSVGLAGAGYLGYWDATGSNYYKPGTFTILPYWETPDEIEVNGISTRTVTITEMTKTGISKSDE